MKKYQLICMSFDGDYVREDPKFETIDQSWEYSNNLGSKWFFYPFPFIVSGETVRGSLEPCEHFNGRRIKSLSRVFKYTSMLPEAQNMQTDDYVWLLP